MDARGRNDEPSDGSSTGNRASSNEIFIFIARFRFADRNDFFKIKGSVKEFFLLVYNFLQESRTIYSNDLWSFFFFYAKRVIKHGRYRVLETNIVWSICGIFLIDSNVCGGMFDETLIVDRVYGSMNSLFNNRYVQFFFFLFVLYKYFSTRISRILFTILLDRKKVEIYDIRTRGFLLSHVNNLKFVKKNLRSFSLF